MTNELKKKTSEWMKLERMTIKQRQLAEEFYEKELMKLIEKDFILRNKSNVEEDAEYFVVSVGTSYEPIVLNISLFKPKHILFLYTSKTEETLNKIVKYCELEPSVYHKRPVSETNPLDIYKEIKHSYLEWNRPKKMFIDFTGGTKAMSAAAAMAAAMINIQLVYVGTDDYLVDFRKPNPGSETLYYIANPLAIFGDLEIEKAMTLFSKYNYSAVNEKIEVLKESIPDPNIRQQLNFVYLLAKTYEAWDSLDFIPAYNHITKLCKELSRDIMVNPEFLMMDFLPLLMKQKDILNYLKEIPGLISQKQNIEILKNKDMVFSLMFTMCQNGLTRNEQEKYDMATLLFYRLLEMIEQERLSKYDLFVSKMDYNHLKYNFTQWPEMAKKEESERIYELKRKVYSVRQQIFGKCNDFLAEQVSLLDGFIILYALGDPIVFRANEKEGINYLKKIRSMVFLRNNSIFAHGLGPVSREDFTKFMTFVIQLFKELCQIEEIDFDEYSKIFSLINPVESKYYSSNMEE